MLEAWEKLAALPTQLVLLRNALINAYQRGWPKCYFLR